MIKADRLLNGSIPEIYDALLVPLIFEGYAGDLASRVARQRPQRVLEIAAGTGVVTRALAQRLDPEARVTATDLNQPMLDFAKTSLQDERVLWQRADAQVLPFENQSFDAVVCQFGYMFLSDRKTAYAEAYRVLKPGGRFYFNVWDELAKNAFAKAIEENLAERFPQDPPRFLSRVSYSYFSESGIRAELETAGFKSILCEPVSLRSRAETAKSVALAYCHRTPLGAEIEARAPGQLNEVINAIDVELKKRFGREPIEGAIRALVFTASR